MTRSVDLRRIVRPEVRDYKAKARGKQVRATVFQSDVCALPYGKMNLLSRRPTVASNLIMNTRRCAQRSLRLAIPHLLQTEILDSGLRRDDGFIDK